MKREDKELLLKDLCDRLPYKVKVLIEDDCDYDSIVEGVDIYGYICDESGMNIDISIVRPYLFPLSSMTEKQYDEFIDMSYSITERGISMANYHQIDWFNKNHFDYRGLIDKKLAVDATNLNVYVVNKM